MGNRHWRLLLIGVLCIGLLSSTLASAQSFGMAYDRGYREGSIEDDYDDQRRPSRDDDDRLDDDRDRRGRDDY